MTARTHQQAMCMEAAERDIRAAMNASTVDSIFAAAAQTPAMQFLERNSAAIDAIRAARIAEGGVL